MPRALSIGHQLFDNTRAVEVLSLVTIAANSMVDSCPLSLSRHLSACAAQTSHICWNIESTMTYCLGSSVVRTPFMKWGSPRFESWSNHFSTLTISPIKLGLILADEVTMILFLTPRLICHVSSRIVLRCRRVGLGCAGRRRDGGLNRFCTIFIGCMACLGRRTASSAPEGRQICEQCLQNVDVVKV